MERWFPDVSYCHFQSMTGECLPLEKAVNFRSLSFVDLWPISRLFPLLPCTCLFWNSTFLFGMLWRALPLIISPFLLLSPDLCNCLFYLWEKKMYRAVVFLFRELSHVSAHRLALLLLLDSSLPTLFHHARSGNIFLKNHTKAEIWSIAPKGVNPSDSKIAEDVTTQILNTEKTPVLHRHNWPMGIQQTLSVIPLVVMWFGLFWMWHQIKYGGFFFSIGMLSHLA